MFPERHTWILNPKSSLVKAAGVTTQPESEIVPVWRKVGRWLGLLVLLAAAFTILIIPLNQETGNRRDTLDFANFYVAGKIVREGKTRQLYDLALQQKIERKVSPGGPFQPYYHPPFQALFFAPFTLFSYAHAFLFWAAMNLLVLGILIYLLPFTGCQLHTWAYVMWIGICLFFALGVLALGQDTLLLVLVFLLAFLAMKRRRELLAGVVLGLGLFRFEILLPFAFIFLLRRRWKIFAGFCAVGVVELLISAVLIGWGGLLRYVQTLVMVGGASTGAWADRTSAAMMPCLRGAFDALLGGVIPENLLFPLILVGTLALLGWAAWQFKDVDRPEGSSFDLEFCLASVAALLSGYHVFLSELTPLIVVGYLVLAYETTRTRKVILGKWFGAFLLLLFFAVVAVGALIHSQAFSIEVVVLIGLMIWLSQEIAVLRKSPASG